jgi:putative nucleotidyltransferase with HDIG domain
MTDIPIESNSNLEGQLDHNFVESEKKINQLATLVELGAILNSSLEPKEVINRAMEAAIRLMQCEVGSLLILDAEKNELFFEVALGEKGEAVKEMRLKVGEGIAGWVAEHMESLIVPDVSKDQRHSIRVDDNSGYITRDILCVPVTVKQKLIGVLQAVNKRGDKTFNNEDLELFQLLANQVAIAIENATLYDQVHAAFLEVSEALAQSIEKRDPYTGGHTKRVLFFSLAISRYMNLSEEEMEHLKIAAILHDIGKIGIEDKILRKKDKLTDDEYTEMKKHPIVGAEIIAHIKQLKGVIPGMRYHHERTDGRGYPEGLKGPNIPFIARIISVADTFDAMTTDRPYHTGLDDNAALAELKRCADKQFDKDVVDAFLQAYENGDIRSEINNNPDLTDNHDTSFHQER